jgi:short-subunit dehydrogenase
MGEHDGHSLAGQVAIVTGASSGLGRATATALAQAGAHVALLARSAGDLEQVGAEVAATGQRALALRTDLGEEDAIVFPQERMTTSQTLSFLLLDGCGLTRSGRPQAGDLPAHGQRGTQGHRPRLRARCSGRPGC